MQNKIPTVVATAVFCMLCFSANDEFAAYDWTGRNGDQILHSASNHPWNLMVGNSASVMGHEILSAPNLAETLAWNQSHADAIAQEEWTNSEIGNTWLDPTPYSLYVTELRPQNSIVAKWNTCATWNENNVYDKQNTNNCVYVPAAGPEHANDHINNPNTDPKNRYVSTHGEFFDPTVGFLAWAQNASIAVPGAPAGLTATLGDSKVSLSWTAPADDGGSQITDYIIEYTTDVSWNTFNDGTGTGTTATVTGLANNTTYHFRVSAVNAVGTGLPSDIASAMPFSIPAAPSRLHATAGDKSVSLAWAIPPGWHDPGDTPGYGYITEYRPVDGKWVKFSDEINHDRFVTVTGLTNGTKYEFRVIAVNPAGIGPASAIVTATPIARPDAPASLVVAAGDSKASLSWTAPGYDGGSKITDYIVEYRKDAGQWAKFNDGTSTTTSATVTGLANGVKYEFRVRASTASGVGSPSNTASAMPFTVPGAPTTLIAFGDNLSAQLTWIAPTSNGGSQITDYIVEYRKDAGQWITFNDGTSTEEFATVTGLTNGTKYEFRVSAVNAANAGSPSNVASATPTSTPGTPTDLAATPGNAQVSLTWNAPSDAGQIAIIDYTVGYRSSNGQWKSHSSNAATSTSVTGLTNGVKYEFRVSAFNFAGMGPASATVTVMPFTVPEAPTDLTTVAKDGQVMLSWKAPADNGSRILDYVIKYMQDGTSKTITYSDGTGTGTTATVTGLTNSIKYNFYVSAVNAAGTGPLSAKVSATPFAAPTDPPRITVPGAPTGLAATPGNAQASLSWTAPTSTGGAAISDYTIQYKTASASQWSTFADGTSTGTTAAVTGLTNGIEYQFRISAVNSAGTGTPSGTASATPTAPLPPPPRITVPGAPTGLAATPGNAQASLSWTAPTSTGGAAISDYTIQYKTASASQWSTFADGTSTGTTAAVTGLTNGIEYQFRISAVNSAGTGTPSGTASATPTAPLPPPPRITVPGAPTGLAATPGNAQASLSWTAPTSTGGAAISDYTIQYKTASASQWSTFADGTSTGTTAAVTGLTNGIEYQFRISAVNSAGTGTPSGTASATPTAPLPPPPRITVPGAPTGLAATPGNAQASLSWTAPTSTGGAAISDYTIQYKTASASQWSTFADGTSTGTTAAVTGLTNGIEYQFRISAVNSAGTGTPSKVVSATPIIPSPAPIITVPGAPGSLVATPDNSRVSLSWSAPSDNGGAPVSDYVVKYKMASAAEWNTFDDGTGTGTTATITGLTNGIQYEFRIMAVNSEGSGPVSVIESVTPITTITIGVIVPITGSLDSVGKPINETIKYAVGQFNMHLAEQNRGWKLGTSVYNDGSTTAGAMDAISALNKAGIKSVIGPASSGALHGIEEYVDEQKMLAISYGSTAPTLADDDRIFRTVQNDTHTAEILAQALQDDDMSDVIIVFRDDSWGNALSKTLMESLETTGVAIRDDISYATDTIDYEDIAVRIGQSLNPNGPTGIVLFGFDEIIHIVDTAATDITFGDTRWYSVDFVRDRLLEDDQRRKFLAGAGFTTVTAHVPTNDVNMEISRNISGAGVYSYAAYDAVFILGMAIDEVESSTDTDALADAIPSIAKNYAGALGNTMLDGAGDLAYSTYIIKTLQADMGDKIALCGPAKVAGKVFADTNGNGIMDYNENGIEHLAVFVGEHHGITNDKGEYTVSCLDEDKHTVKITSLPSQYSLPDGNSVQIQVSVLAGQPGTVDFALVPIQSSYITLNVLAFDDNIMDAYKPAIPGITVITYTPATSEVGVLITGADGTATKSDIAPYTFYAIALPPKDHIVTTPHTIMMGTTYVGMFLVENPMAGSTHMMDIGIKIDPCANDPAGQHCQRTD